MKLKGEFILKEPQGILKEPKGILKESKDILKEPQDTLKENSKEQNVKSEPIKNAPTDHPRYKKPHIFSSYVEHPDGVVFETQEENEKIVIFIRRDFVTNIPWIFAGIFLIIVPALLFPFLPSLLSIVAIPSNFQTFAFLFYFLTLFGYILLNFSLWYFHVSLVTSERVIDIDVRGITQRDVAEIRIEQIQDVSYNQNGFLRSLFDYGDITIQTAGTQANVEFDKAPRPARIVQVISDLIQQEVKEGEGSAV